MAEIHHRTTVEGDPASVFEAISTQEGLRAFWTDKAEAEPKVGSVASFGFPGSDTVFRMRVDKLEPGRLIEWHCLGNPDNWRDTVVRWELSLGELGGTQVEFHHLNWRSAEGEFPSCSFTWAMILDRLNQYCKSGKPAPYFYG